MIIDSEKEYLNFIKKYKYHELIINVIGKDVGYHSAVNELCAIFIKSIIDGHDFVISVCHPDTVWKISKDRLVKDLLTFESILWTIDKKKTLHFLSLPHLNDALIYEYTENGSIIDTNQFETKTHIFYKNKYTQYNDINCVIPLAIHAQFFECITDQIFIKLRNAKRNETYYKFNNDVVEAFQKIESHGLKIDPNLFKKYFENKEEKIKNNFVYTEYNLFTSTGRPSNRHGNINYAALKKDDGSRSCFISRYDNDGYLFMIDYSAYHPRLIANLVKYNLPSDVYNYLGKFYYHKDVLTEEELKASKNITFQLLYGNIPEKYMNISFFKKIREYIDHRWQYFITHGYVETPVFKRQITPNNISDPNPNKLFNYILQASETEYNVIVLNNLHQALDKKLTKPILYTYDSILFDIHKSEENEIISVIKNIMLSNNKFSIKLYKGQNYHEMSVISV